MKKFLFVFFALIGTYAHSAIIEDKDSVEGVFMAPVGVFHLTKKLPEDAEFFTNVTKGNMGEQVARRIYEATGFSYAGPSKIGSNNGIDLVMISSKGVVSKEKVAFLHEAKFSRDGSLQLSSPDQCSRKWCEKKLEAMAAHSSPDIRKTEERVRRYQTGGYWRTISVLTLTPEVEGMLDKLNADVSVAYFDHDTRSVVSTATAALTRVLSGAELEAISTTLEKCSVYFYVLSSSAEILGVKYENLKKVFRDKTTELEDQGFTFRPV